MKFSGLALGTLLYTLKLTPIWRHGQPNRRRQRYVRGLQVISSTSTTSTQLSPTSGYIKFSKKNTWNMFYNLSRERLGRLTWTWSLTYI